MEYGYVRVSSKDQNIARQIEDMYNHGLLDKFIYIDKQSGKDFEREKYKSLKRKLKQGDVLFVKSIDRLGRDYDMIIQEWRDITFRIGADIVVIDMPLLDTREKNRGLTGKFISDLVLQILSYVAEIERENIKKRQTEGIKIAKQKNVKFGRPKTKLPENFDSICKKYVNKEFSLKDVLEKTQMKKSVFYKYLKIKGFKR